jgi:glutamyl-Q tRNA(Asp) synthetase
MSTYRGRFAPSPTGPLHFGSLLAAMASYADARAAGGKWLVRMEDVDTPRTVPGAAEAILAALTTYGFERDGSVVYQSARQYLYAEAFERLRAAGLIYPCGCSRKDTGGEMVYPGTCREGLKGRAARAWRVRVKGTVQFRDLLQGEYTEDLEERTGDFVLLRADGLWAYQLAVVVDDALQGITHVVRGADLLSSTPRQIYLQRLLGHPQPSYLHIPVAVDEAGDKLSKQTGAQALGCIRPADDLVRAAALLGHSPPDALARCTPAEFWRWLIVNWDATRIPAVERVQAY